MATRTPLVLVSGQIQQLQSGDSIAVSSITGGILTSLTNDEVGTVVVGAPVYIDANNGFKKAKADASGTKDLFGLVADTAGIAASAAGNVISTGVITLTTGQWDAVMGTSGGLTKGVRYFVSAATAGLGTATCPSTTGQYVQEIGIALSTTALKLTIPPNILL